MSTSELLVLETTSDRCAGQLMQAAISGADE